jgi:hypothetical protein
MIPVKAISREPGLTGTNQAPGQKGAVEEKRQGGTVTSHSGHSNPLEAVGEKERGRGKEQSSDAPSANHYSGRHQPEEESRPAPLETVVTICSMIVEIKFVHCLLPSLILQNDKE